MPPIPVRMRLRFSMRPPFAAKSAHPVRALGFIPTEWYPTEVAVRGNKLYVATAKSVGTGPNNGHAKTGWPDKKHKKAEHTYIATLLYGSLATVDRGRSGEEPRQLDGGDTHQQSNVRSGTACNLQRRQKSNSPRHLHH